MRKIYWTVGDLLRAQLIGAVYLQWVRSTTIIGEVPPCLRS